MSTKRPNILLIVEDHKAYYRHGWDDGPKVLTPHLDRVGREGAQFTRAYTPCPLCMPARRSLLTGVFPHRHGLIINSENQTPADLEMYFTPLARQGYANHVFGKWHAGPPGSAIDRGCRGLSYPSFGNPYAMPEYRDYLARKGLPTAEHLIEWNHWRWRTEVVEGKRYKGETGWCNATGITVTPEETHEAFFLADLACDALREHSKSDQPFAMRVDFWGPHQPYFPTREYLDLYEPRDIPEYGSFHDDLRDKPDVYRRNLENAPFAFGGVLQQPSPAPWREWQEVLARCYAHVTMLDAAGGRILNALDELGLAEDTLVIWTADHGDAIAAHGGHFDKGTYLIEETTRIPLSVRWPGVIEPGQQRDELVSLLDVTPTMLEAAETELPHELDGASLLGLCANGCREWREDLMIETSGYGDNVVGRALVTDRYRYATYEGDMSELYDLESDPFALRNLIHSDEHAATRADMQARLKRWRKATDDAPLCSGRPPGT